MHEKCPSIAAGGGVGHQLVAPLDVCPQLLDNPSTHASLKQRAGVGKGIPETGAAVVAGPEELDGAPEAAADEAPKPRGADVAGVELKLKAVGAAAEEEEGSGVLTARGKVAEVVAGAELAEVEPGKLNESAEAAAAAPDAGAGLNPNEGAAKQVHDSRIQNSVKLINSMVDMQEKTVVFLMWTYTVIARVSGYCTIDTEFFGMEHEPLLSSSNVFMSCYRACVMSYLQQPKYRQSGLT